MEHTAATLNKLTEQIIGAAIEVHRVLGPGLLESAYEACLYHELVTRGMKVERQRPLPLVYAGVALECAYRMDMVVEDAVVVEVKSVAKLDRVHDAQMPVLSQAVKEMRWSRNDVVTLRSLSAPRSNVDIKCYPRCRIASCSSLGR